MTPSFSKTCFTRWLFYAALHPQPIDVSTYLNILQEKNFLKLGVTLLWNYNICYINCLPIVSNLINGFAQLHINCRVWYYKKEEGNYTWDVWRDKPFHAGVFSNHVVSCRFIPIPVNIEASCTPRTPDGSFFLILFSWLFSPFLFVFSFIQYL